MSFDLESALVEVQTKTAGQIQQETAYKWASRAVACFVLHRKTGDTRWLLRGEDYKHEAIEHAAFADDNGATMFTIRAQMRV